MSENVRINYDDHVVPDGQRMTAIPALPISIRSYVSNFVRRWRQAELLRAAGLAAAVFLSWMLLSCAIDRLGQLASPARLGMFVSGVVAAALILYRPFRSWLRPDFNWVQAAERIEHCEPRFGQRLMTVTSQVFGVPEHRGSDEMLQHVLTELDGEAGARSSIRPMKLAELTFPWVAAGIVAMAGAGLLRVSGLQVPRLLHRFFLPLAHVPPVTTTRLSVRPRDVDVVQSQPLRIEACVQKLGSASVFLHLVEPGKKPTRFTMKNDGNGSFSFTLASVDRDLHYHVSAGDAVSDGYSVRVLRCPVVSQFRIRYEYPQHTQLQPLTVSNVDGLIEAPVGTEATISITASESLQSAVISIGSEKILMDRTSTERVRLARLRVQRDTRYDVEMISMREVPGGGPGTTRIRAIPDRPPLVQLSESGAALRLNPREIVPLSYEALDDYGLGSTSLRVQVNGGVAAELLIALAGDPRWQAGACDFDLATIKLKIGDVVALSLIAKDRGGQTSASEPLQITIAPRSVDVNTHDRIAELATASQLADALVEQLTAAGAALDDAEAKRGREAYPFVAALSRVNRSLSSSVETGTLLRQSLFRATTYSRTSELSVTLANWIDSTQSDVKLCEMLFRKNVAPLGLGSDPRALLRLAVPQATQMQTELKAVSQAERAKAVVADRENLADAKKAAEAAGPGAAPRFAQSIKRAQEEIAASASELALNPDAADLDNQLLAKAAAGAAICKLKVPVDFAAMALLWAHDIQLAPPAWNAFADRLAIAAQAEALRADAAPVRARDLQTAALAATSIETALMAASVTRTVEPAVFVDYAAALASLQREHEMDRKPTEPRPPDEVKVVRENATAARLFLARWVEDPMLARTQPSTGPTSAGRPEFLALQAGAELLNRNFARARQLDAALASDSQTAKATASTGPATTQLAQEASAVALSNRPRLPARDRERAIASIRHNTDTAEKIDSISRAQEQIAEQTRAAKAEQAPTLAGRQRGVADALADVQRSEAIAAAVLRLSDDPDWRERATQTILVAQERLAAMPQQLATAAETITAYHQSATRAETAMREAAAAPVARQPTARRAALQAEQDVRDSTERLERTIGVFSPQAVGQLNDALDPFAPEGTDAQLSIDSQLLPALRLFETSARAGDAAAAERAAAAIRVAVEAVQKQLAQAQEALTERDPIVAAKWFAQAAADSLASQPPDFPAAQRRQKDVSSALSRAWDQSVHDAAAQRLAALPSLTSILAVKPAAAPAATARGAGASGTQLVPGLVAGREWGRLRPREPDQMRAPSRDPDPVGFEEPLRLYFEALGKARDQKGVK